MNYITLEDCTVHDKQGHIAINFVTEITFLNYWHERQISVWQIQGVAMVVAKLET